MREEKEIIEEIEKLEKILEKDMSEERETLLWIKLSTLKWALGETE